MAFEVYAQFPGALPAGGTTLTSATELAYQTTTAAVEPPETSQGYVISGYVAATGAAGTTSYAIKCRRGSGTGGTQVGNTQTQTVAASAAVLIPYSFQDLNPPAGQTVYTITVTAAGANATANDGAISLRVPESYGAGN